MWIKKWKKVIKNIFLLKKISKKLFKKSWIIIFNFLYFLNSYYNILKTYYPFFNYIVIYIEENEEKIKNYRKEIEELKKWILKI